MINKPDYSDPKVREKVSLDIKKKYLGRVVSMVFMTHINRLTKDNRKVEPGEVDMVMNSALGELVQDILSAVADFGEVFNKFTSGEMGKEEAVALMGNLDISEVHKAVKEMEAENSGISISKDLGL